MRAQCPPSARPDMWKGRSGWSVRWMRWRASSAWTRSNCAGGISRSATRATAVRIPRSIWTIAIAWGRSALAGRRDGADRATQVQHACAVAAEWHRRRGGAVAGPRRTLFAQIAAEAHGTRLDDVRAVLGDTERTPYTGNSWGSMTVASVGPAVRMAAEDARAQLFEAAAGMLDAEP